MNRFQAPAFVAGIFLIGLGMARFDALAVEDSPTSATQPGSSLGIPKVDDPVILRVNGEEVTQREIDAMVQRMMMNVLNQQGAGVSKNAQDIAAMRQSMEKNARDQTIGNRLLRQAVRKKIDSIDNSAVDQRFAKIDRLVARQGGTLESFYTENKTNEVELRKQIKEELAAIAVIEERAGPVKPTDEDVKKFFDENKEKLNQPEKLRISHILLGYSGNARDPNFKPDPKEKEMLRAQAEEILAKVKAGEDFAKLAAEKLSCPSKAEGGDLGLAERDGGFVKEFEEAAWKLKPGEVSPVVETMFGFHIIKVTDQRPAKRQTSRK